jgi:hypothetical protein
MTPIAQKIPEEIKVSHFPADNQHEVPMEIGPIPGTQDFTAVKVPAADFQLTAVVNMEAVARPDHSARAAARKKGAGAEEAEEDDTKLGEDAPESSDDALLPHISFFA